MVIVMISGIIGILYIPLYLVIIITYFFVSVKCSKEVQPGIPDQTVPTSSPTALGHAANDTACLMLHAQAGCKEKEGKRINALYIT